MYVIIQKYDFKNIDVRVPSWSIESIHNTSSSLGGISWVLKSINYCDSVSIGYTTNCTMATL